MPIDTLCSGCGKTLRVNDEYAGRRARCPVCGTVYTAGGIAIEQSPQSPAPGEVETVYAQKMDSNHSQLNPINDSWTSLPTTKPIENLSTSAQGTAFTAELQSPSQIIRPIDSSNAISNNVNSISSVKYFVRTPNSMVYGPSSVEMVNDWITEGRLDDSCHIREETSENWLGIPAWRFQSRRVQNPMSNPFGTTSNNQFGAVPVSSVQSLGYSQSGNGGTVLILGLISWVLCPTFFGAIICGILAIIFAMAELKKIRNSQIPSKEKSIVMIGLLLAIANLVAWSLMIVGFIVAVILNP